MHLHKNTKEYFVKYCHTSLDELGILKKLTLIISKKKMNATNKNLNFSRL